MSKILKINPNIPEPRIIDQVIQVLDAGGVIIYPTDTVYGLGCNFLDIKAVERIYQIKGKSPKQPLSMMLPDLDQIGKYARVSNRPLDIMRKYLPGPYTFVLPTTLAVPGEINRINRNTIGVRIPDNKICMEICARVTYPIISTSANLSGSDVITNPAELKKQFEHTVDLIIDAGTLSPEASTVVDLTTDQPRILRQGSGVFNDQ